MVFAMMVQWAQGYVSQDHVMKGSLVIIVMWASLTAAFLTPPVIRMPLAYSTTTLKCLYNYIITYAYKMINCVFILRDHLKILNTLLRCVCRHGYSGNGMSCQAINRCQDLDRGGCHMEVFHSADDVTL